jgi:transposase InsO family protein
MHIHSNATTNKKQRERMIGSKKTCRALAQEMAISLGTVHRWKHRDSPEDKSCRPLTLETAFDEAEQAMILALRQKGLPLDDLVDLVQQPLPTATRSSVYRLLARNGVSRLPKPGQPEQQETGQEEDNAKHGQFKDYGPGFVHIDCFYLPKLEGQKRYCFVAIDRSTRLSFLFVYENKNKKAATDFLNKCLAFFPFKVSKILTDNGREFTLKGFKNRWGTKVKDAHDFEQTCKEQDIEHRTTLPYTPKTNGMVERMNGLTKENTTKLHRYETAKEMQEDLQGWFVRYNFCRKNRRIGRKTPYEAALSWYEKDKTLFIREPTALLVYRNERSQSNET